MPVSMMQPDLQGLSAVPGVRSSALERWYELGWPGPKDEAWRFTRLASLDKLSLRPADASLAKGAGNVPAHTLPDGAHIIHFHNNILSFQDLPENNVLVI